MTKTLSHFIGGEYVTADAAAESLNPSNTNDVVALVPEGGDVEVDAAVSAARAAFPAWSEASPEVRSDLLDKVGDVILRRREDIGRLLSLESGAPPGVFNMTFGPGSMGARLVEHERVDGVSFTGSQRVGASVGRAGVVMVNLATAGIDYHTPFGGSKKSSYGAREQGFAAIEFFTQTKTAYSWA